MKFIRKFLFHRSTFIFFALLIQLGTLIGVILRFSNYFVFFYGISISISIVVIINILNNQTKPAYKIPWIILILIFPIFGGLIYVLFGRYKLNKRLKKKMRSIETKMIDALLAHDYVLEDIELQNEVAANQSKYIRNYAYCPPYTNTVLEYFPIGEKKFIKLKEELKKAEYFIFLEYFIIEEGFMWNSILEILKDKASQGVDVRVIYDDVGCLLTLPYGYDKKLRGMGIQCCIFNPLLPLLSMGINHRDHRKIAVIDGHTGFTGGINLADEYINQYEKYGHWKDAAIMVKGEAVWSLTVMFLSMWDYLKEINEDFLQFKYKANINEIYSHDGFIQPFTDNPLDDEPVGEIVYLNLINKSRKTVYITTPYLIIGNEMTTALSSAAKSGIDVRIITPHKADKWYIHPVTRSYYKPLIESGVKIYEYLPGFIHSKTFIVDDEYGVVGTINMDYRSLNLHFECGVWMFQCSSILDIKKDFLDTLELCKRITMEDIEDTPWYKALMVKILRVFEPLM